MRTLAQRPALRRTTPRRSLLALAGLGMAVPLSGCSETGEPAGPTASAPAPEGARQIIAERVLQVTSPHEATGMTLLEGPTFDAEGRLHLVDVTAPDGAAKVMRIDLDTEEITPLVTSGNAAFTSAQWSPLDERLHLTDYAGGRILSVTAEGTEPRTEFEGEVEGRAMQPDDLAFDEAGNCFISDSAQTVYPGGEHTGRVVRLDAATGEATVLADGLANPNGISYDPQAPSLWVSLLDANRVDRLLLDEEGRRVTTGHTAIHVDGGPSQTDSNALDGAGNLYQGMHGIAQILVFGPDGALRARVSLPAEDEGLDSSTNLAIAPGTTTAYVTVSGPAGGFLYRFEALGEGIRSTNGG